MKLILPRLLFDSTKPYFSTDIPEMSLKALGKARCYMLLGVGAQSNFWANNTLHFFCSMIAEA